MQENPKAATPQLYHRTTQKVQVLEAAAAQANPVQSVGRTDLAAHFADCHTQSIVKTSRNFSGPPAPGEILHDRSDDRPEVEDHGFAVFHFKVVAPFDSTVGHRFERNCSLAFEGDLRSHTQKRSDG